MNRNIGFVDIRVTGYGYGSHVRRRRQTKPYKKTKNLYMVGGAWMKSTTTTSFANLLLYLKLECSRDESEIPLEHFSFSNSKVIWHRIAKISMFIASSSDINHCPVMYWRCHDHSDHNYIWDIRDSLSFNLLLFVFDENHIFGFWAWNCPLTLNMTLNRQNNTRNGFVSQNYTKKRYYTSP